MQAEEGYEECSNDTVEVQTYKLDSGWGDVISGASRKAVSIDVEAFC